MSSGLPAFLSAKSALVSSYFFVHIYLQCGSIFYSVFWCNFFMDLPSFKYCSKVGPFSTVRNRSITLLCSALPLPCCWDNLFGDTENQGFVRQVCSIKKCICFIFFCGQWRIVEHWINIENICNFKSTILLFI